MGLRGTTDSSVYKGLRDVLQWRPAVTAITYEPDSVVEQFLRARIGPSRVVPLIGPESPTLDVEWRFVGDESCYRIHYADPNTGFDCGWHRDDDHPGFGPVHFQYDCSAVDESDHERARFAKTLPTEVLWTVSDRSFEQRIPTFTNKE